MYYFYIVYSCLWCIKIDNICYILTIMPIKVVYCSAFNYLFTISLSRAYIIVVAINNICYNIICYNII